MSKASPDNVDDRLRTAEQELEKLRGEVESLKSKVKKIKEDKITNKLGGEGRRR